MNTSHKSGSFLDHSERIGAYVRGELEGKDLESFETKMAEDPFLRDAVEGFQEFPDGLSNIGKIKNKTSRKINNNASLKVLLLWTAGALLVLVSSILILLSQRTEELEEIRKVELKRNSIEPNADHVVENNPIIDSTLNATFFIQDTDSSVQVGVATKSEFQLREENFLTVTEIPRDSLEEMLHLEIIPLDNEVIPEAEFHKNYNTYHIENYKLFDYRDERDLDFTIIKPIVSGVPASQESEDTDDPMADLVVEELTYEEFLNRSISKLSVGKYGSAKRMFNDILDVYPNDVNALFYRAYCSFLQKKYTKSNVEFEASINCENQLFIEEARFHKALSLYHIGENGKALDLLTKIIDKGGFYSNQAEELKDKIDLN